MRAILSAFAVLFAIFTVPASAEDMTNQLAKELQVKLAAAIYATNSFAEATKNAKVDDMESLKADPAWDQVAKAIKHRSVAAMVLKGAKAKAEAGASAAEILCELYIVSYSLGGDSFTVEKMNTPYNKLLSHFRL